MLRLATQWKYLSQLTHLDMYILAYWVNEWNAVQYTSLSSMDHTPSSDVTHLKNCDHLVSFATLVAHKTNTIEEIHNAFIIDSVTRTRTCKERSFDHMYMKNSFAY
ncbi:hypothetical protein LSAT2_017837 [Lamellibrachia satsuma]|nr:hypothetical protein LSAT2_017837 [Lamellibrachia satsuma]